MPGGISLDDPSYDEVRPADWRQFNVPESNSQQYNNLRRNFDALSTGLDNLRRTSADRLPERIRDLVAPRGRNELVNILDTAGPIRQSPTSADYYANRVSPSDNDPYSMQTLPEPNQYLAPPAGDEPYTSPVRIPSSSITAPERDFSEVRAKGQKGHPCPCCGNPIVIDLSIPCPTCGKKLTIRHRHSTGQAFIGCMGFPTCRYATSIQKFVTEVMTTASGNSGADNTIQRRITE